MIGLRRQIRESNDALGAAVSGNEHLRQQMREQKERFEKMNEAELTICRQAYERGDPADGGDDEQQNAELGAA